MDLVGFWVRFLSIFVHGLVFARAICWIVPRLAWRWLGGGGLWRDMLSAAERPYVALLSFIEWDGAWQRPQHLATGLAAGGREVVYCSPVRAHRVLGSRPGLLWRGREEVAAGLTVLRPLVLPLERRLAFFRFLNACIVLDALGREGVRRGGFPEVLLCNSPFFHVPFLYMPAGVRVYDVMDELTDPAMAGEAARRLESEALLGSDAVTAGTRSVARLKEASAGVAVRYIGCGVDVGHFGSGRGAACPADLAGLPRPILGFFGALNERIDEDLLAHLARAFPEGSIVLIGPVYRGFGELAGLGNVHFAGPRAYGDLPGCLSAFDCALVPYRLTGGVEYVQPVKILEYLAGGKPVVSTAIPDVVELYGDVVRVGGDASGFVAAVRDALGEGGGRAEVYARAAQGRSWGDMVGEFGEVFADAARGRAGAPRGVVHLLHGTHLGGAEEVVLNLCVAHGAGGRYRASVIALGAGERVAARARDRGVAYRTVGMRSRLDIAVSWRLVGALRAVRGDILHTHTGRTNLVGRLCGRLAGLPVVTTVHTAIARDINDVGGGNRLSAWVDRLTRLWSARTITVSEHNRREAILHGAEPAQVVCIRNGVRTDLEEPDAGACAALRRGLGIAGEGPVVGMVASLRPRKGPEVLLRAFAEIRKEFGEATLLMVGSAEFVESRDYLSDLQGLAGRLGIGDRVIFTGHREDAADLMWIMDVVALPSLFGEGLPLTILEAMARSRPVVASDTEGNDEVVAHGETGLLFDSGDSGGLAGAVLSILRDGGLAESMGREGRRRARALYDIGRMAGRYEEVYDGVWGQHFS